MQAKSATNPLKCLQSLGFVLVSSSWQSWGWIYGLIFFPLEGVEYQAQKWREGGLLGVVQTWPAFIASGYDGIYDTRGFLWKTKFFMSDIYVASFIIKISVAWDAGNVANFLKFFFLIFSCFSIWQRRRSTTGRHMYVYAKRK